jgi:hypothetical protein|tara:strand:+ start:1463 stop:1639 length:177 start_codon:yes stop_codon:yes gene_type:complete
MKYKNKDGIELSYTGNDMHTKLVKEVISEAIAILDKRFYPECKEFLKENFNIEDEDGR